MTTVIITYLPQPTLRVSRPKQFVDETEALEAPILQLAFEIRRLFCERERLITNNTQARVGCDVNSQLTYGNVSHIVRWQPMLCAKVLKMIADLTDGSAPRADP